MKKDKEGKKQMATQIAATPILRGKDAKNLLKSLKRKSTEKSKANGENLINFFRDLEKKGK